MFFFINFTIVKTILRKWFFNLYVTFRNTISISINKRFETKTLDNIYDMNVFEENSIITFVKEKSHCKIPCLVKAN